MKKSLLVSVIAGLCLPHYVVLAGGGEAEERAPSHTVFPAAAAQADTGAGVEDFDEEKGGKRKASSDEFDRHIKQELMAVKTETVTGVEGIGKRDSGIRESTETPHKRTVRSRVTQEVKNSWKHLSEEVKLHILEHASFQDLGRVAQVSRQSKRLADDVRDRRFENPHLYVTHFENAPAFWAKIMLATADYVKGDDTRLLEYRAFFGLDRNKSNDENYGDSSYDLQDLQTTPYKPGKYLTNYLEEFFPIQGTIGVCIHVPEVISVASYFFDDTYFKAQEVLDSLTPRSLSFNFNLRDLHILPPHAFTNSFGLTALSLVGCKFGGRVPPEILNIPTLKVLRMSYNGLRALPDSIFDELPGLTNLNVRSNNLTKIPSSIGRATNLARLNIGQNREIREFPDSIEGLRNLTSLYMFDLGITEFPSVVGRLPNLTFLNVGDSNFSLMPSDVLRQMTSLTALNINNTRIGSILDTVNMWRVIWSLPNFKHAVLEDKIVTKQGTSLVQRELDDTSGEFGSKDEEHADYEKFVD